MSDLKNRILLKKTKNYLKLLKPQQAIQIPYNKILRHHHLIYIKRRYRFVRLIHLFII